MNSTTMTLRNTLWVTGGIAYLAGVGELGYSLIHETGLICI